MFGKLTQRLHNYQKWNPIEYQNLEVSEGVDTISNTPNKIYYIDLSYKQYDINIIWNNEQLIILINHRFNSRNSRFYLVPPVTINQENIRFNAGKYYMFPLDRDLIKMFKVVFKLKFYNKDNPYFETKNDILSQT